MYDPPKTVIFSFFVVLTRAIPTNRCAFSFLAISSQNCSGMSPREAKTFVWLLVADSCIATSRVLVQDTIANQFIAALKAAFEDTNKQFGANPADPGVMFGPMATKPHYDRVVSYLSASQKAGEIIVGGKPHATGLYIEPTIVLNPDVNSPMYKEEIFGPILALRTFKTEEEAIELANDTEFGLNGENNPLLFQLMLESTWLTPYHSSAMVFTRDISRALRVAEALESGRVTINRGTAVGAALTIRGWKQSGQGSEHGVAGLEEYLQEKLIAIGL
jgi:aldehyde dehydrogenase (NAD+)